MTDHLTPEYWSERYRTARTGWDLGGANVALLGAFTTYVRPEARVLIPGAGRGHEAEALWKRGYEHVYVCDWAEEAFVTLRRSAYLPSDDRLLVGDFFELGGLYDAILEQTFFCAIDPGQRDRYVAKCADLLAPGGRWIGVLFDRDFEAGPPFGGSKAEYRDRFSAHFDIELLGRFGGSIAPRAGRELLGVMTVKQEA